MPAWFQQPGPANGKDLENPLADRLILPPLELYDPVRRPDDDEEAEDTKDDGQVLQIIRRDVGQQLRPYAACPDSLPLGLIG